METEYTKRELDEHFRVINEKIDLNTSITKELDKKVGIQNGRVSKLESRWIGVVMAGAVIVFLFTIISALIVYSFQISQENLKSTILLELKK